MWFESPTDTKGGNSQSSLSVCQDVGNWLIWQIAQRRVRTESYQQSNIKNGLDNSFPKGWHVTRSEAAIKTD
jgi:hypothetical protein